VRSSRRILREGGPRCLSRSSKALARSKPAIFNARTAQLLHVLHPKASAPLPPLPPHRAPGTASIDQLDKVIRKRIHNGSAAGPSGWGGSHLFLLWTCGSPNAKAGLSLLIRDIMNGVFTGQAKVRLLASNLIPCTKKNGGLRPIAIGEVWAKCAAHCAMALIEHEMPHFFPSIQFGVKHPGGSDAAAHLIRAIHRQATKDDPSSVVLKTDFQNAFNTISRASVWRTLLNNSRTEPMLKAFYYQYSDPTTLLVWNGTTLFQELSSDEGVRQGDPFAAFAFALTVQPLWTNALKQAPSCKGISVLDDFNIIGPVQDTMKVYDYIHAHAPEDNLHLVPVKCQVFAPIPSLLIETACRTRHLSQDTKMESLGVMFGSPADIAAHCMHIADNSDFFFMALAHPEMGTQEGYSLLRQCGQPRMNYLARTTYPELLDRAAASFDKHALSCAMTIFGQSERSLDALQESEDDEFTFQNAPRTSLVSREQLLQRMSLPISAGGLGLRPIHRTRHAAYFSALLSFLADFLRLYPHLQADHKAGPASLAAENAGHAYQSTELHAELQACRAVLLAQGAGNRRERRLVQNSMERPLSDSHIPSSAPTKSSSTILALNKGIDAIWLAASECARESASATFVLANKLQHQLTVNLEDAMFTDLFSKCGKYQQSVLTSLSENSACSSWLTVLPTEPAYRMRDEQFCLAVRHRLGQLPYDDLIDSPCLSCRAKCVAIPYFRGDPDHFHSCICQTGVATTQRHHRLVNTLATLARSVGFVANIEPPLTSTSNSQQSGHHKRGDLKLIRHNLRLLVDVTVTRPSSTTALKKNNSNIPLAAAGAAEARKHRSYDEACAREGLIMVPFAMESYGATGKEAQKLLHKLADASETLSAQAFLTHASAVMSVSLQCGNADIASLGTQHLRELELTDRGSGTGHSGRRYPSYRERKRSEADRQGAPLLFSHHSTFHAASQMHPERIRMLAGLAA